jgi:hypothetical protein
MHADARYRYCCFSNSLLSDTSESRSCFLFFENCSRGIVVMTEITYHDPELVNHILFPIERHD